MLEMSLTSNVIHGGRNTLRFENVVVVAVVIIDHFYFIYFILFDNKFS